MPLIDIGDGGKPIDLPIGFTMARVHAAVHRKERKVASEVRHLITTRLRAGVDKRKIERDVGAHYQDVINELHARYRPRE